MTVFLGIFLTFVYINYNVTYMADLEIVMFLDNVDDSCFSVLWY